VFKEKQRVLDEQKEREQGEIIEEFF